MIEIGEVQPEGVCTQRMIPHSSPILTFTKSPCHPNPGYCWPLQSRKEHDQEPGDQDLEIEAHTQGLLPE